ncbi:MAG: energy transducer TonB, partial [Sphingobium sp.]
MAYADQSMSSSRMVAIIIVVLLHAVLGYAFVTGLAYNVVKKAAEDLNVFDVEDEPPPPEEEPPPPPPEKQIEPPPVVTPPPIVQTNVAPPPPIQMTPVIRPPVP